MDCSLPGSSVHGIFQARVLEWGAIAFSTSAPKLTINNRHFYESPWSLKGSLIHHLTFDRIRILIWKEPWKSILQSSKLRPVGLPSGASGKEPVCQCRRCKRCGFNPWSERSPGGGHGSPLQYSFLENPMDRGAWQATVHRGAQSWTQLKWLSMHTQTTNWDPGKGVTWPKSSECPSHHWDPGCQLSVLCCHPSSLLCIALLQASEAGGLCRSYQGWFTPSQGHYTTAMVVECRVPWNLIAGCTKEIWINGKSQHVCD